MTRMSVPAYQRRVMIAMTIYMAVFLWVWPLARSADALWMKTACALAPVPPILYVIWLMARRVRASDELEQRTHLVGLGVASAIVAVFGIIAGLLATSHVFASDSAAVCLIWIFPLMIVTYTVAQGYAARRYGSSACFEEGLPMALRFLTVAAIVAAVVAYGYWREGNMRQAGTALGMAVGIAVGGGFFAALRWWQHRSAHK